MTRSYFILLLAATLNGYAVRAQGNLPINEQGRALKAFYLGLNVENLWLSGQHVDWETGVPDRPGAEQDIHTHCSAFVAAACKRLNVYVLRPPEHKTLLLANAQYDWLQSREGQTAGWTAIKEGDIYRSAQQHANEGDIVIATFKNADPKVPGHIALVRPAEITPEKLVESGPMLIMAGTHNFNYISLKAGFRSHISTWPEHDILFYYHTVPR